MPTELQVLTVTNRLINNHTTTSCSVRKVTPHGRHVRGHFTPADRHDMRLLEWRFLLENELR